mmetsp:Transcript_68018/g.221428  ORF Transcript_68018/g.221428 Transcript_68018/m.221428 type:complete len:234 (-) Transcript_68018:1895-2596(-)
MVSVEPPAATTPNSSGFFNLNSSQATGVSPSEVTTSFTKKPSRPAIFDWVQRPMAFASSPPTWNQRRAGGPAPASAAATPGPAKAWAVSAIKRCKTVRDLPLRSSKTFAASSGRGCEPSGGLQNSRPRPSNGSKQLAWPGKSTSGKTMMPLSCAYSTMSPTSRRLYCPSRGPPSNERFNSGKFGRSTEKRQKSERCNCKRFMRTRAMPSMTSCKRASLGTKRRPTSSMRPLTG